MNQILYETAGEQIGILTLNRPKTLNAFSISLLAELGATLDQISISNIRCLIITGAGDRAFGAGADISEMMDFNPDQARALSYAGNSVMEKVEGLPMPIIAAVNGYALGAGFELALSCDIRIASTTAVFGLPEVTLGILPGYGGIQRLERMIGASKAREMTYTAARVDAQEALELSIVNAVYPPDGLMEACMEMAGKISTKAPFAVRASKRVFNQCVGLTLEESTRIEAEPFAACFTTWDCRQAMTAFVQKRKAEPFTGR